MNRNETYYYGQGRVLVATRQVGQALNMRWVGDVDRLTVTFANESQKRKVTNRGKIATVDKYVTHQECMVSANFYEHSLGNLGLALFGDSVNITARSGQQIIPPGVVAGGRYVLDNQNIWDVFIPGLIEGVDFNVDSLWGAIEVIKTPIVQPIIVKYKYAGGANVPLLTRDPIEVTLRYEGVNLAENMRPVLVELYRVQFDVASVLDFINNDTALSSFELSADVLLDTTRNINDVLGQYGRYVVVGDIDFSNEGHLKTVYTTSVVGGEITTVYPGRSA
jgi:hypothetical protein